ncbi:MAG: hypothetical protein GYB67_16660, partial [Chloroflexi bacterium]|nr:hypothetical protein [Chloroflexota bacterium]
ADANGTPIARIESISAPPRQSADRALCQPITIQLLADVSVDLKAALIIENTLGWPLAQTDAIFADAAQRTSSALGPGDQLSAYPLLRLPYGAPPGNYRLRLRLYDETTTPSGYLPDRSDVGRAVDLGVWTAAPGADWPLTQRPVDLPVRADHHVGGDLTLVAHDLPPEPPTLNNGSLLQITLLWSSAAAREALPTLTLRAESGGWSLAIPPSTPPQAGITRDWRAARIPAHAEPGGALLMLPDGTTLARYQIEALPLLTDPPPYAHAISARFPGVGALVGYTLTDPLQLGSAPQIRLIWRAESAAALSYTVFVQLIDADGFVIAQSDSIPMSAARPTTGWRADEFIEDGHTLRFNARAAPGPVRLIAGLYDAATGERLRLPDGRDAVTLAEGLIVE